MKHCIDCSKEVSWISKARCYPCSVDARTKPIEKRFWKYVEKTSTCWLWSGGTARGYGVIGTRKGDTLVASRVSWEIHKGPIPAGMLICHRCDVRRCVRPSHLFLGTQKENMEDMWNKQRDLGGHKNPCAAFTKEQIEWIRENYKWGKGPEFSKKFGVSTYTIWRVINHKTYH